METCTIVNITQLRTKSNLPKSRVLTPLTFETFSFTKMDDVCELVVTTINLSHRLDYKLVFKQLLI